MNFRLIIRMTNMFILHFPKLYLIVNVSIMILGKTVTDIPKLNQVR
jgi:hypothetical protein